MSDDGKRDRQRARRVKWIVRLGGLALRALAHTWRIREVNSAPMRALRARGHPVIFALWHGDMLPLLWHHRRQEITILVSEHRDGEIIARIAESLGYRTVRGSSTRGADRALIGMSSVAQAGGDLAFTPDGPRGPAGAFAPGALVVAQRTGAPVVPLAAAATRCWRLASWDHFLIPKPFTRVTIAYGAPTKVTASSPRAAAAQGERFAALLDETVAAAHG